MNILAKYLVTLFGIGFIPFAPGTLGSLCAIFVWYLSITFLNIYFGIDAGLIIDNSFIASEALISGIK